MLGIFILNTQLSAQEDRRILELNSKIGPRIDQNEKEEYKLFPNIPNFHSAQFYLFNNFKYFLFITEVQEDSEFVITKFEIDNPLIYFPKLQQKINSHPSKKPIWFSVSSTTILSILTIMDQIQVNKAYDKYKNAKTLNQAVNKWDLVEASVRNRNRDIILTTCSALLSVYFIYDYFKDKKNWIEKNKQLPQIYFNPLPEKKQVSLRYMIYLN